MDFTPHEFAELYQEIYKDLYRYARFVLGDEEDAKDVVSEAVLDGFRQRQTLKKREAFRGWLFAILANKCKRKKKEYVDRRQYEQIPTGEETIGPEEMPDGRSGDLSGHAALRMMFFQLGEEERTILSLHLFAGYSSVEIGNLLGQPPGTIRSKEHRALEKLRKEMKEL
ncbi:MAG: RNA polymerase sigma factor [Lachnospiraceae bacterium]|nr:RNA polymerase sigma factor [Lachnospiraceae bacterium]